MSDANRKEFSVVIFFPDGTYDYVRRFVTAKEAWGAFARYVSSPAALTGITVRVIITDGGDHTNAEWKFGEGLTFPKPEQLRKMSNDNTAGN